jgi:hypothetical protein
MATARRLHTATWAGARRLYRASDLAAARLYYDLENID